MADINSTGLCAPLPDTVSLSPQGDSIVIIEQTLLPGRLELLEIRDIATLCDAIRRLAVRGAPAIGVSAAMGVYLSAYLWQQKCRTYAELASSVRRDGEQLCAARPTAVNLRWAVERMLRALDGCHRMDPAQIPGVLRRLCLRMRDRDIAVCRAIGENGLSLLFPGDGILTHCNAGQLATVRYGTATAPIYLGTERGYHFSVYADETRPLLQGARLTAFELQAAGVDVTLECDGMSASLMRQGRVQAVIVGCDRVAANGDFANKIGTFPAALAARRFGVPFYVAAPLSSVDLSCRTGLDIPIEQRDPREVTEWFYRERMTADGVSVYNPAFDITDCDLVTAYLTESGIARPPFDRSLVPMAEAAREAEQKEESELC